MAQEHGPHQEHGAGHIHLPDPSPWPFVTGAALLLLGAALVWWSDNRDHWLAGPMLGAGIVATLFSVGGWAYEDGKMRRKAELREMTEPRTPRYTQVIAFAIPEGQWEAARAAAGVLSRLEAAADSLRDLAGFQDLRVIASPAADGPSQVLVETTWSGREELASYEESRQTLLDILAEHPEEVQVGSVQAFDMQVVRDTKDVAFRFSLPAAASVFAAFAIGGLALAAGLAVFQEESVGGAPSDGNGGSQPGVFTGTIVAQATRFRTTSFELPPNTQVTLTEDNRDNGVPHNIAFFAGPNAEAPPLTGCTAGCPGANVATPVQPGPVTHTFTFTTPGPGSYFYHCDVHPATMTGVMTIREGAPVPGQAPPGAAAGQPTPGQ
jgi:plastocyanin